MENFKIELMDQTLDIQPKDDGTYAIFENEKELGILKPVLIDEGVLWESDRIGKDYAQQIGELIEEYEM